MELTIEEAAARMGKSLRQIRYQIQLGHLKAHKRAGRWFVELEDVPKSAAQAKADDRKQQTLRNAVEEVLGQPGKGRGYSLADLRAFQIGLPLYRELREHHAEEAPALEALRRMLRALACGCHRYAAPDKSAAYRSARDEASTAVCELLLSGRPATQAIIHALEHELLPAVAGLLRRVDRGARIEDADDRILLLRVKLRLAESIGRLTDAQCLHALDPRSSTLQESLPAQ